MSDEQIVDKPDENNDSYNARIIPANREDWNIRKVILSCLNLELCLAEEDPKKFVTADISEKIITSVLEPTGYDFFLLLKLEDELRENVEYRDYQDLISEDDSTGYNNDICDNCGCTIGTNHDCTSSIENLSGGYKPTITIEEMVAKLAERIITIKKNEKSPD